MLLIFTIIMPKSVPVRDVGFYIVDNHFVNSRLEIICKEKSSHIDKVFIRMKFCRLYDLINIFAVQKYSGDVFKNRSTQSRK